MITFLLAGFFIKERSLSIILIFYQRLSPTFTCTLNITIAPVLYFLAFFKFCLPNSFSSHVLTLDKSIFGVSENIKSIFEPEYSNSDLGLKSFFLKKNLYSWPTGASTFVFFDIWKILNESLFFTSCLSITKLTNSQIEKFISLRGLMNDCQKNKIDWSDKTKTYRHFIPLLSLYFSQFTG